MLIDRRNLWKLHGRWLIVVGAGSAAASGWCLVVATTVGRWPGGGSLPGLTLGGLAAAIFLFELALVAKKTRLLRTSRWMPSAQIWMKAHIWLGLFTVPLVLLHSGGQLGGPLTTLLLALFGLVIGSGLWGLALQNVLPRILLDSAPSETVYSQIDAVGRQYAADARRLVFAHCGVGDASEFHDATANTTAPAAAPIRGAARQVGSEIKRAAYPERTLAPAIASPAVNEALAGTIEPFLATGIGPRNLLGSRTRNQWFFDDLRLRVVPGLRDLVAQLEELCERRRQLNLQRRVHFWLHNWLWLHLPLSVLLLIFVAAHILLALRYD